MTVLPSRSAPIDEAPSVLIVSASMGGGHDGVAHELARRLRARGVEADVVDFLSMLPFGLGVALRAMYRLQLRVLPSSYDRIYRAFGRPGPLQRAALHLTALAHPRLRRCARGRSAVVATYPLAAQALGRMRSADRLDAPVLVYVTEFSVHPTWIADGIDAFLVLHEVTADELRRLDPDLPVTIVGPLVRPGFVERRRMSEERRKADERTVRRELGVADDVPLVLLVAGSWGTGDVIATAREVVARGLGLPVVVCGHNRRLRAQVLAAGLGPAIGWTDDMAALVGAADLMIQNAGGLSSIEAFAAGLPVVSLRCLPGHGHANADAMAAAGLAPHLCRSGALANARDLLGDAVQDARARRLFSSDPTDDVCDWLVVPTFRRRSRSVRAR